MHLLHIETNSKDFHQIIKMTSTEILKRIREIQNKNDRHFFAKGLFPSFRKHPILKKNIPDDNIFFSASIVYILNTLTPYLSDEEKDIVTQIHADLKPNFKYYSDNPDRNSFNFWKKEPYKHFPNGSTFSKLHKFILPDDIDTTSLIQLTIPSAQSVAFKTKDSISDHANLVTHQIKNGHRSLRTHKAYSTWFGKNMPIEFDICVLSNLFLWIHKHQFNLNKNDLDSLKLIEVSILDSLYFKSSYKSAPEYPQISIIFYHIARMISTTQYLVNCKEKLISDIKYIYSKTNDPFQLMILSSSLYKLDHSCAINKTTYLSPDTINHWWFTAGLLSTCSSPLIQSIASSPLFHYRFYCPAFNLALYLENELLKYLYNDRN